MDNAQNGETSGELIITESFNGLLGRVAKINFFDVWMTGRKILKKAKTDRVEATIRMSEVSTLTGLTKADIEVFLSLGLISVIAPGEDPLLSFRDVFCLVKIFERFVNEGLVSKTTSYAIGVGEYYKKMNPNLFSGKAATL